MRLQQLLLCAALATGLSGPARADNFLGDPPSDSFGQPAPLLLTSAVQTFTFTNPTADSFFGFVHFTLSELFNGVQGTFSTSSGVDINALWLQEFREPVETCPNGASPCHPLVALPGNGAIDDTPADFLFQPIGPGADPNNFDTFKIEFFGQAPAGGTITVAFSAIPVPEPAALALALAGLGVVVLAARGRRGKKPAVAAA